MASRLNVGGISGLRAALAGALICSWGPAVPAAAAAGLFDGMGGAWKGDGSIAWTTGETEHMRCTAKYEVQKEGNRIVQGLTCATDSTRLIIKSTITYNPAAGAITGDWSETSYGINGYVTGTANATSVNALVQSTDHRFTAKVTVITRGTDQTVTIAPQGLDVTNVAVKLKRGGGN